MTELKKFTRFVKETCIADIVHKQQELLTLVPASSTVQNDEKFYSTHYLSEQFHIFLSAVEEGVDTTHSFYESIHLNGSPLITITSFLHAQKQALYTAIPVYTTDVATAVNMITELDKIVNRVKLKTIYEDFILERW